ncbi:dihydrodipicolinate synthase family protein [Cohnella endophytica]|uniref:Dihydrodipicolinate synthase family protein n=1 Tax=Cohnella endophytica TaxID=2419778 RepID=A0A494XU53_9BACL|nr:dihydrodipicolinate synthase family protein [Cohnella endophytica]RKP54098.1 dihydrodipicolinate synthase family protein [Cohnella endophytica]
MNRFSGVYVAIITPFDENLELDLPRLRNHVDWLIEEGVDGIVPTGSVGEYASLSPDERKRVVETVIDAAAGRVPVVVGTAAPSTQMAVQWAQHAKQAGAKGIMALPPINYRPSETEVFHHYESLSAVGLPIIVYNNPHDYPTDMKPAFLQKLSAIDHVVAVKEFSGDIRRVHDIQRLTDLTIFVGVDDLAMEGGLLGASGWIAGLTNVLPAASLKMFKLAQEGKLEEALKIYRKLLPLFHWDASPRLVQAIKYGMELAGRPMGQTRPPRLPLTEAEQAEIREAFEYALSE